MDQKKSVTDMFGYYQELCRSLCVLPCETPFVCVVFLLNVFISL